MLITFTAMMILKVPVQFDFDSGDPFYIIYIACSCLSSMHTQICSNQVNNLRF